MPRRRTHSSLRWRDDWRRLTDRFPADTRRKPLLEAPRLDKVLTVTIALNILQHAPRWRSHLSMMGRLSVASCGARERLALPTQLCDNYVPGDNCFPFLPGGESRGAGPGGAAFARCPLFQGARQDDLRSRARGVGPEHQAGRAWCSAVERSAGEVERSRPMAPDSGWCFGPYPLAGPQGPLCREAEVVPLPPKALAVLWGWRARPGRW